VLVDLADRPRSFRHDLRFELAVPVTRHADTVRMTRPKELVIDALGMASIRRRPQDQPDGARTIAQSDHGSQYTDSKTWQTRDELVNATFEWIACWYNTKRRHSSIGMRSPATFEALHTGSDHDH